MRLRKTMKRTAAAVLALSMAVSAAAMPASAGYTIDMSDEKITGNVEIKQETDGSGTKITISVDGKDRTTEFTDDEAGDKITITGDNTVTKPAAATTADAEAAKDDTKAPETTVEENKDGTVIDYTEKQDAQPEQEASRPEGAAPDMEADPAGVDDQQEETDPEADKDDPDGQNDQNNQSGQNTQNEDSEDEDADAGIMTYEAPAPTTLTSAVEAAARKVISIINNATGKELAVTLKNLKVDAGDTNKSAVTVSGTGDVTLELDGKNELKGGTGRRYPSVYRGSGLDNLDQKGTLTITDEDKNGSLTAVGGDHVGVVSDSRYGGNGIFAKNLTISGATVTAVGGGADDRGSSNVHQNGSVGGDGINANGSVKFSNATVTATGGSAFSDKTRVQGGIGLEITSSGEFIIDSGTNLTVTGGSAESETGRVQGGQGLYLSGSRKKMTVNGATLTLAGGNAKTNSTDSSSAAGAGMQGRPATNTEITNSKVTVIGGDLTGGRTKKANAVTINVTLKDNFKLDGDTTFTCSGIISNISAGKITVAGDATLVQEDNSYNKNTKIELEENGKIYILGDVTVTENEDGTKTISGTPTGKKVAGHDYKVVSIVEATCTTPGKITYRCETADHSDTDEDVLAPLGHDFVDGVCNRCGAPEQAAAENGGSSAVTLTVTGAGAYETSMADGRYIIAVPAENAVLSGCLSNLKELKAQGVNTLVFRTQLRETALNIDSMLSLGVDDTLFALTHSGESAELTVGGFEHNELIH